MKFFFNFERVLLATRGCSRTLKTPNSPPLSARYSELGSSKLQILSSVWFDLGTSRQIFVLFVHNTFYNTLHKTFTIHHTRSVGHNITIV